MARYQDIRPLAIDQHPVSLQKYIIPTPSLDAFYDRIKKCIRLRTPGAIVHGQPRYGKTYGIRYAMNVLLDDFPNVVMFSFLCHKKASHSESAFFANLLESVGHKAPQAGTISAKRSRLVLFLMEKVDRSGQNLVIVFADEAQRLDVIEYEWLRDVHDELERRGVRMITFLVGQSQLLHQKNAFRASKETQIIARFMVDEMAFRGLTSVDDVATCLAGYDESMYPMGTDWTYTRFFFPLAFESGFRLVSQAQAIWDAFRDAHDEARLAFMGEIPMQYFTRTVEIALTEYAEQDADDFRMSPQIWMNAVGEANYIQAEEEMQLMFADGEES